MNHGRFQIIHGPTCGFCNAPKMVCYTNPCKGTLDHVADVLLRAELRPKPKPVPLIKGGQGRRRNEVERAAITLWILGAGCAAVGALMVWGMR